jgi:hypothetical protein
VRVCGLTFAVTRMSFVHNNAANAVGNMNENQFTSANESTSPKSNHGQLEIDSTVPAINVKGISQSLVVSDIKLANNDNDLEVFMLAGIGGNTNEACTVEVCHSNSTDEDHFSLDDDIVETISETIQYQQSPEQVLCPTCCSTICRKALNCTVPSYCTIVTHHSITCYTYS